MSEPDTDETTDGHSENFAAVRRALDEWRAKNRLKDKNTAKVQAEIDLEGLFDHDSLITQVETQVSLLTSAMSQNMILATGVFPSLTEGRGEDAPNNVWLRPKAGPARNAWAEARSLHLRDAARLSFATASLVGAYTKLKGPARQRFTTRHTIVPDPAGKRKPRKITTITHHLVCPQGDPSATVPDGGEATNQSETQ